MASRSSTSSIKDNAARPGSPTLSSLASKRSSMAQNRSSIIGTDQPSTVTGSGWMSGLSEVMANVSSRVVNTRAQEQHRAGSVVEGGDPESEPIVSSQRSVSASDTPASPDLPPWVAPAPSEHDSVRIEKRSGSKRSSGSRGPGSNHGDTRTSHQGPGGDSRGLLHNSKSGSNLGKSNSVLPEKPQDDNESVFAPGGFAHRGTDKMKLEGRSLLTFGPDNPLRVWLASILMSKYTDPIILVIILAQWVFFVITPTTEKAKNDFGSYWTHYALLAINIIYT
ncbi:hypothetical protein BGZ81_009789 [Podila clonocystis]|nr:hypothetical protein BGZ81_009789 [Podila clonocystis]